MGEIAFGEPLGELWNALQTAIGSCIIGYLETYKIAGCSQGSMDMAQRKTTASSLRGLQTVESTAAAQPIPCSGEAEASLRKGQPLPEGRRITEMHHLLAAVTPKQLCHGSHRKTSVLEVERDWLAAQWEPLGAHCAGHE